MSRKNQTSKLCKIVYFDEDSVTDYMQIVAGGNLEKTTELLNETSDKGKAGGIAEASIGIGGTLKALLGFGASVSVESSLETSFDTNNIVKNIVKNTILSDFIDVLENSTIPKRKTKSSKNVMRKLKGYTVSAPKDSLSYIALISPYLSVYILALLHHSLVVFFELAAPTCIHSSSLSSAFKSSGAYFFS